MIEEEDEEGEEGLGSKLHLNNQQQHTTYRDLLKTEQYPREHNENRFAQ